MKWKREKKIQLGWEDRRKTVKPNAFSRAISMFRQHLGSVTYSPVAPVSNEERQVIDGQRAKIELMRSMAIEYLRHNSVR